MLSCTTGYKPSRDIGPAAGTYRFDEATRAGRDVARERELHVRDALVGLLGGLCLEGRLAHEEFVAEHSYGPIIDLKVRC
jgi:hypothetical protein